MMINKDDYWMMRALQSAVQGEGLTRPNPPVGAVLVKNGVMVGQGFHPKAGQPHAEIVALRAAGAAARGATFYVTLEPCSTQGRTPPCTEAIIRAGIERVVYGCADPNPAHAGRADAILRRSGLDVTSGVLRMPCEKLIRPFSIRMRLGRPMVTLKLACTLDGRIADAHGASRWITGARAREAVQGLRRTADAVMVGAETVRADNPSLRPRPAYGRSPLRVILAGSRALPLTANLFTDAYAGSTVVLAPKGFRQRTRLEKAGIRIREVASSRGAVSPIAALKALAGLDCLHVVCEGGGRIAQSLLKAGLVDQLYIFYGPKIVGSDGRPAVAGKGWRLDAAPSFTLDWTGRFGNDVLVVYERTERGGREGKHV